MKIIVFWLIFHLNLLPCVQLERSQHWFPWWIVAWHRIRDKALSETMMARFTDASIHHSAWIKLQSFEKFLPSQAKDCYQETWYRLYVYDLNTLDQKLGTWSQLYHIYFRCKKVMMVFIPYTKSYHFDMMVYVNFITLAFFHLAVAIRSTFCPT